LQKLGIVRANSHLFGLAPCRVVHRVVLQKLDTESGEADLAWEIPEKKYNEVCVRRTAIAPIISLLFRLQLAKAMPSYSWFACRTPSTPLACFFASSPSRLWPHSLDAACLLTSQWTRRRPATSSSRTSLSRVVYVCVCTVQKDTPFRVLSLIAIHLQEALLLLLKLDTETGRLYHNKSKYITHLQVRPLHQYISKLICLLHSQLELILAAEKRVDEANTK
jgi:hypothetical protein